MSVVAVSLLIALIGQNNSALQTTFQDERTGILIKMVPDKGKVPGVGDSQPPRIRLIQDQTAITTAASAVMQAMLKYNPKLLRKYIECIYVFREMTQDGQSVGGVYTNNCLYLSARGFEDEIREPAMRRTFHHEFAHCLAEEYSFILPRQKWESINPPGFQYLGDGLEAIKLNRRNSPNAESHAMGFWSPYGTSSFDEDFATVAEALLSGDAECWKAIDEYPRFAAKVKLAVGFYNQIDPHYTEAWFRSLVDPPAQSKSQGKSE